MRVVIAEDAVLLREGLSRLLIDAGHEVVRKVDNGPDSFKPSSTSSRTSRSSTCACRQATEMKDCGPRSRPANSCLAPPFWSFPNMSRSATPAISCDRRRRCRLSLKDRVADVCDFLHRCARWRKAERCSTRRSSLRSSRVIARTIGSIELTAREREVLSLMAEGRSNSAIADYLSIGDGTVEKHISNIFSKLGLEDSDQPASPSSGGADLPRDHRRAPSPVAASPSACSRVCVTSAEFVDTRGAAIR